MKLSDKEKEDFGNMMSTKEGRKTGCIAVIIIIFVIFIILSSCFHSCKKEHERIMNMPKQTEAEKRKEALRYQLKDVEDEEIKKYYLDEWWKIEDIIISGNKK